MRKSIAKVTARRLIGVQALWYAIHGNNEKLLHASLSRISFLDKASRLCGFSQVSAKMAFGYCSPPS